MGILRFPEASDIVQTLINEKINFHKLQRLSLCEGFSEANTKYPDKRITELEHEKSVAKAFFQNARVKGFSVKINGTLEIAINN